MNLEPPQEAHERKVAAAQASHRKGKDEARGSWGTGGRKGGHGGGGGGTGGKTYSKLAYPDHSEPSSSEGRPVSPEENSLTPLLDEDPPSSRGSTIPRRGNRSRVASRSSNNSDNRRDSMTSPEDDASDDKDENRKSPWQKIEDRPLMVFHPKK